MSYVRSKPAILGGKPVFPDGMPFAQPTLPDLGELTEQLYDVFASKNITNGKYVREFEKKAAEYLGVKQVVAVSSCTSGLMLSFRALGLTGEVIVPSFTFSATVQALLWNGLKPVFVDCDPKNFNLDSDLIEDLITPKTSAIVGVYVFGMPPDIGALQRISGKHDLKLVFDAAHAFGSRYFGRPAGGFGDAEIFSLSPTKLLATGEGGLVATNDDELAYRLKIGRDYANPGDYNCQFLGLNARMPEFNAVLGLKNLETIEQKVINRNRLAEIYKRNLDGIPGLIFQEALPDVRSTYKDLSVMVSPLEFGLSRDELEASLEAENIKTKKYYYPPVHKQKFYTSMFGTNGSSLAVTEHVSRNILSLPMFSHMREEEVKKVCSAVRRIHRFRRKIREDMSDVYENKLLQDFAGVR